jgi:hypothetical protein
VTTAARAEADLRRCLDRAIGRALFDKAYEQELLAQPVSVLNGVGVTPQQYVLLRDIRAPSLAEFARLAQQAFWPASGETTSAAGTGMPAAMAR